MQKITISEKELQNLNEGFTATVHLQQAGMTTNSYEIEMEEGENKKGHKKTKCIYCKNKEPHAEEEQ